MSALSFRFS